MKAAYSLDQAFAYFLKNPNQRILCIKGNLQRSCSSYTDAQEVFLSKKEVARQSTPSSEQHFREQYLNTWQSADNTPSPSPSQSDSSSSYDSSSYSGGGGDSGGGGSSGEW